MLAASRAAAPLPGHIRDRKERSVAWNIDHVKVVAAHVKGYRKPEWQKTRERNEALDTRIYARAAASHFGIDRFQKQHWAALERQMGIRANAALAQLQVVPATLEPARQERNQRSPDPFSRDDRFSRDDDALVRESQGWFDR
jgi:phage terminase large subunit GpA-like protein